MSSAVIPEPPAPPPPGSPATPFDFLRPFTFVFDDPRWVPKVLMGGLFALLSFLIVGIFFLYGYMARLVRNVIAGMQYPLPEWDDLGEYFAEGLKLFAVAIVYAIPIGLIIGAVMIPAVILGGGDNETARNIGGLTASCIWCLIFPLSLALAVWMPGALLMVIVTGRFSAGFEFSHIADFIRANLGNYLLAFVVWLIARFAAGLGFLLLCVGLLFTMFWAFTVAAYAFGQVYRMSTVR
jgi:uncharacterized protein DUF4013